MNLAFGRLDRVAHDRGSVLSPLLVLRLGVVRLVVILRGIIRLAIIWLGIMIIVWVMRGRSLGHEGVSVAPGAVPLLVLWDEHRLLAAAPAMRCHGPVHDWTRI